MFTQVKKIKTWVSIYGNEVAFSQFFYNVNGLPFGVFFKSNDVTFVEDLFNVNELPIWVNGVNEKQILIVT